MNAEDDGYKAFRNHARLCDNPHETGGYQHWCGWADGWIRAKNEFQANCKTPRSTGRLAYQLGDDQLANPYERGTLIRYQWQLGFEAAEFANKRRAKDNEDATTKTA